MRHGAATAGCGQPHAQAARPVRAAGPYNASSSTGPHRHAMSDETETLLCLYRTMVRIRAFEDAAEVASQGGVSAYGKAADGTAQVRGPLHLSTGQEAVPAGVCAHLRPDDYL